VIVDTGSTDGTTELVRQLADRDDSVLAASISEPTVGPGGPVVRAFSRGLALLEPPSDVVVKIDADVTAGREFFETVLERMASVPALGIVSGAACEWNRGRWRPTFGTDGYVAAQCRFYRWRCLLEILPLEERIGWDGLDIIEARLKGWQTRRFADLPFLHHRAVGQRETSKIRFWLAVGGAMHYMGYRPYYAVLRAIFNARRDPRALASVAGLILAKLSRASTRARPEILRYVRRQQAPRHLARRALEALGKEPVSVIPSKPRFRKPAAYGSEHRDLKFGAQPYARL
jgi:glycosyltransferase involved in cell wall biosynthesis